MGRIQKAVAVLVCKSCQEAKRRKGNLKNSTYCMTMIPDKARTTRVKESFRESDHVFLGSLYYHPIKCRVCLKEDWCTESVFASRELEEWADSSLGGKIFPETVLGDEAVKEAVSRLPDNRELTNTCGQYSNTITRDTAEVYEYVLGYERKRNKDKPKGIWIESIGKYLTENNTVIDGEPPENILEDFIDLL